MQTSEQSTGTQVLISPLNPTVGTPLTAVLEGAEEVHIERYFWYSCVRGDAGGIRALAGDFNKYTPTKKLRGRCIAVTVHFVDGSTVTSEATQPCTVPIKSGHAGDAHVAPPPNIPTDSNLRSCKIIDYDLDKYDFRSVVKEYLGIEAPLEQLHQHFTHPKPKMKPQQHYKGIHDCANWTRNDECPFVKLFDKFIQEVVRPSMCEAGDTLIYQAKPSLRVQPPGSLGIRRHRDAEYHHQSGEVNWWIPLTECYASNTLQLESSPDQGDFQPLNLQYGQLARFWGNQCLHGTLLNETPTTRVSLDFRVVCGVDYDKQAAIGLRADGSQRFQLGGYYKSTSNPQQPMTYLKLHLPFKPSSWHSVVEDEVVSHRVVKPSPQYRGWILVQALPFLQCDQRMFAAIATCSTRMYRAVAAQVGSSSIAPKQWREWRTRRLDSVESGLGLTATVGSTLDVELGVAARTGVPPSFASQDDRTCYTLKHLKSRSGHLADILTLTTPSWLHRAVVSLVLGRPRLTTLSLGGGPGFDAIAVGLASGYLAGAAPSSHLARAVNRTVVLDFERGWDACACAVAGAYSSVLDIGGLDSVSVYRADITKSLRDPVNRGVALTSPCLIVCAHVVAENAQQLRCHNFVFFRELFARALEGSLIVMTEATHRLWPELVLVAFQTAKQTSPQSFGFDVTFPQVPGKRGYSLVLHKTVSKEDGSPCSRRCSPMTVVDLEEHVGEAEFTLLTKFKRDSDKHLEKAACVS